ncbi:MAG TPA: hypothetical protein ENG14_02010, partial [Thermodesulforhabdus norvegica]|nr:hypothetical protein [Thermodesulforhabdus norvegica]
KELPEYVTEKGNPNNIKDVDFVEISYPAETLKGGVHLIDTPGVGSIFENNTQVTYEFLPKVDAALFLFTVDPPLSQSELEFLRDVRQYVHKIFFIQNKIDYLDGEELAESLSFSKKTLEEVLQDGSVSIQPLSAKLALEGQLSGDSDTLQRSRLPELQALLTNFLTREKGRILLQSALQSSRKVLNDMEFSVELERKAIETPLRDLETKIELFKDELERIQRDKEDNGYFFEAEIKRIMDYLDRQLERLRKTELPRMLEELKREGEALKHLPVSEYVKKMEEKLNSGIVQTFDDWIMEQEKALNEEFARVSRQYSDRTNDVINRLVQASAKLFDIELETVKTDETISSDSRFYYLLGDPPRFFDIAGAVDFFSKKLLPKSLSQKKVLNDLMKKLPERIDANCGRVRADFMHRIRESFFNFRWTLNSKIDATAESIQKALEQAVVMQKEGAAKKDEKLKKLAVEAAKIAEVKHRIEALQARL